MKIYRHTYRYGIETTLVYHGDIAYYDTASGVLTIGGTVWDVDPEIEAAFRYASMTVVTGVSDGDEFSVVRCDGDSDDCHVADKDPESTVLVLSTD